MRGRRLSVDRTYHQILQDLLRISKDEVRVEKMKAPYRVEVKVVQQSGECSFGHQVGDLARFNGEGVEGKICWHSLCSMIYKIHGLLYGANYPWLENKDVAGHPCPDVRNPVIYEIRRFKVE